MTWARNCQPVLAMHKPMTWLHLSDLQSCGPCCTFRRSGQPHCQLFVQFNILVVHCVTTISPRLGRPERPFRDPLSQFSSLVLRINERNPAATSRAKLRSLGRVVLRPSIVVGLQSLRSVSFRCSRWRWPGSVMTRLLVRLVGGFSSSAATVLPILPVPQLRAGKSSARC